MTAKDGARPNLREQHAAVTRTAILDAARRLFAEHGFGATPMRALAEEAGVSVQTIYATFGSKAGVASALNDRLDEEAEVGELVGRIMSCTDPEEVLRLLARMQRQIWERCGDIISIGRQSAFTGDEGAVLWEGGQERHRGGLHRVAQHLDALGALRPGLTPARAGTELAAIANVDTFAAFTATGGLDHDDLEAWLTRMFMSVLAEGRPRTRRIAPGGPDGRRSAARPRR